MGGRDDSVAMLVMVIMIAMTTQLPSTSHGMVINNNTVTSTTTATIFTTSSSAGNGTRCNGHISIKGECLQLNNIKKNIDNIVDDDDVEGDELEFDIELKYAMMEMVEMYSDSTTFITRFLAGGEHPSLNAERHPDLSFCGQPESGKKGSRYTPKCQGEGNRGSGEDCKDRYKRNCHS